MYDIRKHRLHKIKDNISNSMIQVAADSEVAPGKPFDKINSHQR